MQRSLNYIPLGNQTKHQHISNEIHTHINNIRQTIEKNIPPTDRQKKALKIVEDLEDACNDILTQLDIPF